MLIIHYISKKRLDVGGACFSTSHGENGRKKLLIVQYKKTTLRQAAQEH